MDIESRGEAPASLRKRRRRDSDVLKPDLAGSQTRSSTFDIKSYVVHSKKWLFTFLIVSIGVAATAAFLSIGIRGSKEDARNEFNGRAFDLVVNIKAAWNDYELFGLWTHESCSRRQDRSETVLPSEDIAEYLGFCSRRDFRKVYEYIRSVGLNFQALQYLPNVTHDVRAQLETEAKEYYAEHYPELDYYGFKMRVVNEDGSVSLIRQTNASFYFPIHYVEPVENNAQAVGLNIYSNPQSLDALRTSLKSWEPALTARLKLVQETDDSAYSIILQHPGVRTNVYDQARSSAISQVVIRMPDLLDRATQKAHHNFKVYLYDDVGDDLQFLGGAKVTGGEVGGSPELGSEGTHQGTRYCTSLPEVDFSELQVGMYGHISVHNLQVANRQWKAVVLSDDVSIPVDRVFIIVGGCIIIIACFLLALWFHWHLARVARESRIKAEAETTKAELAHMQAVRERHLNDFIAHEVRNPLSAALAALSFISSSSAEVKDKSIRKSLQSDLHVVDVSLHFINDLLRNMLDLHRATSEQMELDMKPTDLRRDVLEPVSTLLVMRCTNVDVSVECPPDLFTMADRLRLKQIILNLSYNAAKFVEKGFIRLRAKVIEGSVQLYVEDSGPGIPLDKRNQLFAKFQSSLDSLNQGTGIGLSVCKSLSKLMGADIELDDSFRSGIEGCPGTRFVLNLHQPQLEEPSLGLTDDNDVQSKALSSGTSSESDDYSTSAVSTDTSEGLPESLSVLFVDDDTMLRRMFVRAVQRVAPSWHVEQAANGETALRLVDTSDFDVIFVDQYMASIEKQMLGTETVRTLRAKGVTAKICGLSANDVTEAFREAGANAFMFKPFPCEKEALQKELLNIL